MIHGGICHYGAGSQLAQAERFIRSHRVRLITIDIGANDVDRCVSGGVIDAQCVELGIASIQANVPQIAAALRQAAGARVTIIGMTYYDPFVAAYLAGPTGQAEAYTSVLLARQINGELTSDYQARRFKVADVATAFDTYVPFTTTTTLPGVGTVPEAVAKVCALTWMCHRAPRGPNIYANADGYRVIAKTFAAEL